MTALRSATMLQRLANACGTSHRAFSILPFRATGLAPASPSIASGAYVAGSADLIGRVFIDEAASIWYQCVLRADVADVRVGRGSNIQDGTIIHVGSPALSRAGVEMPTTIVENCTVGHQALLHACTLQDRAFVGMQACVMDGAVVESDAMVGAGALVTPGRVVKSRELWAGRPAKRVRELTEAEVEFIMKSAEFYQALASQHRTSSE
eukprot:gnl/TRDRNA2_/TRDRNA2_67095_c0_seq1.p1 gnl/TRDRNA2_/TRDRNA2_67095_c0~~gnl/TRDRNA2_/TRDRNA2_67095_c0_seq1.p1  ORF type:complete len:208 (+),score=28.60 gnl/TRDRNA2_/TRDRNA2_67095_c0_seq1:45-668(+)